MKYYQRIISAAQAVLKQCITAYGGAFTLQKRSVTGGFCLKRRDLSDTPSPLFLKLPARLQFHGRKGFTLIEVMMVIAIIGTLAAIAIPNYIDYRQKAQNIKALQTMRTIERELAVFHLDHDYFPETLNEAGLGHLRDPWGNPFQYLNLQTLGKKGEGKVRKDHSLHPLNTDYDLYSMGPDGKSVPPLSGKPSRDDIIRANDGAFLGKGSDY